jgi:hypothetical protein
MGKFNIGLGSNTIFKDAVKPTVKVDPIIVEKIVFQDKIVEITKEVEKIVVQETEKIVYVDKIVEVTVEKVIEVVKTIEDTTKIKKLENTLTEVTTRLKSMQLDHNDILLDHADLLNEVTSIEQDNISIKNKYVNLSLDLLKVKRHKNIAIAAAIISIIIAVVR